MARPDPNSDRFAVGEYVVPKPEWIGSSNNVPSGRIRAIAPWGKEGALYVGDERRAFAAYVFDQAREDDRASGCADKADSQP